MRVIWFKLNAVVCAHRNCFSDVAENMQGKSFVKRFLTHFFFERNVARMKRKRLSSDEIKIKIRKMENFAVNTDAERKRALMLAKGMGADIHTRALKGGKFEICILSDVPN